MAATPESKPLVAQPLKPDVMGALRSQAGGGPMTQKNPVSIIREAIRGKLPAGVDEGKFMVAMSKMLKDPNVRLIPFGNTVFMVKRTAPTDVEFHAYIAEPNMRNVVNSLKQLEKTLRHYGIKKATTFGDGPQWAKIAEMTGIPVKTSQVMQNIGGQMKPVYKFEADLGGK
jgi:hypothetical protein